MNLTPPPPTSALTVMQVTRMARVTGATPPGESLPNPNQTDRHYRLLGTDLGILWDCGHGEVMIAFGDSYGLGWGGDGGGPGNADWRSNVLALSHDDDPARGLVFTTMIQDTPGHAQEVIASRKDGDEVTSIPTGGITVGARHYLAFMSVHHWGLPGQWQTNFAGLAYSDDQGKTWTKDAKAIWKNTAAWDDPFQQTALTKSDGYVYLFGTPNGRRGSVCLARVPQQHLLDKSAYQYWDGRHWQTAQELDAQPVVSGPAGELSVAYNSFFRRWLMLGRDDDRQALVLRDAPALTGPWSAATVVVKDADCPGQYGGFIDPLHNKGPDLYFMLTQWKPYNVFWMHATLKSRTAADAESER